MQLKMRPRLTYETVVEYFEGRNEAEQREAPLTNAQVHIITHQKLKSDRTTDQIDNIGCSIGPERW